MRRVFRRATLALTLAGTLGLAAPGLAQPSLFPPARPGEPVELIQNTQASDPVADRSMEIAVELALLADRATSPYRLTARIKGDKLQVGGFIPGEAVRHRVVEIACDVSSRDVIDDLRLHPQLSADVVGMLPEQIQTEARAAVAKAFPECDRQLALQVKPNGEITVLGWSPTLETKLSLSRCLREVRGCSAVINNVKLSTKNMEEKAPLVESPAPRRITLGPCIEPVGPPEGPDLLASSGNASSPATSAAPTRENVGEGPSSARRSTSAYRVDGKEKDPSWVPDPNILPALPAASGNETDPALQENVLGAEPRVPVAEESAPRRATIPLALPPVTWPTKEPVAPTQASPSSASPSESEMHPGTVAPAVAGKGRNDLSAGVSSAPSAPALLEEAITRACGPDARDLVVLATMPRSLMVRLKVSSRDEGQQISQRIFQLPELKEYQVKLEIKIVR